MKNFVDYDVWILVFYLHADLLEDSLDEETKENYRWSNICLVQEVSKR